MKNKKATINPISKRDNKCFQYAVKVELNYKEVGKHVERITTKSFINKYQWKRTNFPSQKDDWKKSEKNTVKITLNVLYAKKEKIYSAYVSKHKSNRKKQLII